MSEKKLTTRKVGRPDSYNQTTADRLCRYLAVGESLRKATKHEGMPSIQTVFTWMRNHPDFLEQYTRAKQEAADALVEEMLDIADSETPDVNRDRLRVETRKWIAAKLKPKKYGEKMQVDNTHRIVQPILGGATKPDEKQVIDIEAD